MTAHQIFKRVDDLFVFRCIRSSAARARNARLNRNFPGHLHRDIVQVIAERPDVELELAGRPRRETAIGAHVIEVEKIVHGKACTVRRVVVLSVVLTRRAALRSREHKPRALRRDRAPRALTRLFAANQARHAKMATMAASTNRPLTRKSFQKSLRVRTCSSAAWRYSAAVLCCWSSLCRSMPLIVYVCPASRRAILSARSRLSVVRR